MPITTSANAPWVQLDQYESIVCPNWILDFFLYGCHSDILSICISFRAVCFCFCFSGCSPYSSESAMPNANPMCEIEFAHSTNWRYHLFFCLWGYFPTFTSHVYMRVKAMSGELAAKNTIYSHTSPQLCTCLNQMHSNKQIRDSLSQKLERTVRVLVWWCRGCLALVVFCTTWKPNKRARMSALHTRTHLSPPMQRCVQTLKQTQLRLSRYSGMPQSCSRLCGHISSRSRCDSLPCSSCRSQRNEGCS